MARILWRLFSVSSFFIISERVDWGVRGRLRWWRIARILSPAGTIVADWWSSILSFIHVHSCNFVELGRMPSTSDYLYDFWKVQDREERLIIQLDLEGNASSILFCVPDCWNPTTLIHALFPFSDRRDAWKWIGPFMLPWRVKWCDWCYWGHFVQENVPKSVLSTWIPLSILDFPSKIMSQSCLSSILCSINFARKMIHSEKVSCYLIFFLFYSSTQKDFTTNTQPNSHSYSPSLKTLTSPTHLFPQY